MIRLSENLVHLPRLCFTPTAPSCFRVRKQPQPGFCSTVEAIHETIELVGPCLGRRHDVLLDVFTHFIDAQVELKNSHDRNPRSVMLESADQAS